MTRDLNLKNLEGELVDELRRAAAIRGGAPEDLARDLIAFGLRAAPPVGREPPRRLTEGELLRRESLVEELRSIRAMTVQPLTFDSTLVIREMRDTR